MSFLRYSAITVASVMAMCALSQAGAAQSLSSDALVATETAWMGGYMKLGGGLGKAMVRRGNDRKVTTSARRPRHMPVFQYASGTIDDEAPIALVAQTLDHTGLNIGSIFRRSAR